MREHDQIDGVDAGYITRDLSDEAVAPPKERSFPSPRNALRRRARAGRPHRRR